MTTSKAPIVPVSGTLALWLRECGDDCEPDRVEAGALSPMARALAEAVAATALKMRTTIWLESRATRAEMRPDLVGSPWYTAAEMAQRDRIPWSGWAYYPCQSAVTAQDYLEGEARKLPLDYVVLGRDPANPVPSCAAAAADRVGDSRKVLGLLALAGRVITPSTWRSYVCDRDTSGRPTSPQPARHVGRTPLWDLDEVELWQHDRAGWRASRAGGTSRATS